MPGIPCTIYTAAMKLYKLETSLFVGREVKYDFHSDQNKTKNNKKFIIYYYQFGSKKKRGTNFSCKMGQNFSIRWLCGRFCRDRQLTEWEAQDFPIWNFSVLLFTNFNVFISHCVITDTGDIFATWKVHFKMFSLWLRN